MGEIIHRKVSDIPEDIDDAEGVVGPTDWNDTHDISLVLDDLSDVEATDPEEGQVLAYHSGQFVPEQNSKLFSFMGW